MDKIELLSPVGSMANLKAAVSNGADAVYLGMKRFSARDFATNFNEKYLTEAVNICKSNNVKSYLTMNTLVKDDEFDDFFDQLSFAYSKGIDAVIIQHLSFLPLIKKQFSDLRVHISTQVGVMNSASSGFLSKADRITLARELSKEELTIIRKNYSEELEIFCHGALCVSLSGQCLFSSLLGGRSGNRGKCAQPCRKKYDNNYYLSTKELCLIEKLPEIIGIGINAVKIEGRMRTPYYVATVTEAYRKAIDSFYSGKFTVTKEMILKLKDAFNRDFTKGWFERSEDIFNREYASGKVNPTNTHEMYEVKLNKIHPERKTITFNLPKFENTKSKKQLLVRVYTVKDAIAACSSGADIIYFDLFDKAFSDVKDAVNCKVYAVTPRIMLDSDKEPILNFISEKKANGILAGNVGMLNMDLNIPIHLDYNLNCFNDIDLQYVSGMNALPIISPELSIPELIKLKNRNFAEFVHGKIRLMTLRHNLKTGIIRDEKGGLFRVKKVMNGSEIINGKELGLLSKSAQLVDAGITIFYIDTETKVGEITGLYRKILDGKSINDSRIKREYILGWSFRGVS